MNVKCDVFHPFAAVVTAAAASVATTGIASTTATTATVNISQNMKKWIKFYARSHEVKGGNTKKGKNGDEVIIQQLIFFDNQLEGNHNNKLNAPFLRDG